MEERRKIVKFTPKVREAGELPIERQEELRVLVENEYLNNGSWDFRLTLEENEIAYVDSLDEQYQNILYLTRLRKEVIIEGIEQARGVQLGRISSDGYDEWYNKLSGCERRYAKQMLAFVFDSDKHGVKWEDDQ